MPTRFRPSFLSVFLTTVAAIFVIAVALRIRAYSTANTSVDGVTFQASNATDGGTSSTHHHVTSDGGIVDENGNAVSGGTPSANVTGGQSASQRLTPRAQRFNELLQAAPGGGSSSNSAARGNASPQPQNAADAAPAKPQSTLSRLIAPIVNAFSGGSSSASQTPQNRPQPQQPQAPKSDDTKKDEPKKEESKDPSSDVTPPQLIGVEFTPAQIQDGESSVITIIATDDLSGIRSISGSVVSPSGKATQAFAAMRDADPASNRFAARVAIPKDAEEGLWRLNFISLSDNASNTMNLTAAQGGIPPTAVLKVASTRPDSTPPVLKSVWLDKRAMMAGEKNTVFVQVEDDKTGVRLVSGVFLSPSKFARIGFGCRQQGDGNVWECDLTPPKCLDCGDWQLEQIQMQDNANNMATARQDDPSVKDVRLNISSESCDAQQPAAHSVTFDPVQTTQGGFVNVTVSVSDDGCGIGSVSGQVAPVGAAGQTGRLFFNCTGSAEGGTWTGRIALSQFAAKGTYNIVFLQVLDKGNNLKMYSHADAVVGSATFTVR